MNIEFHYMYRDGANYKNGARVVLHNPLNRSLAEVEARVKAALDEGEYFIAEQTGVLESAAFYAEGGKVTTDDHCWHEFTGVFTTAEQPSGSLTVDQLLEALEKASIAGWDMFLPEERYSSDDDEDEDEDGFEEAA